MGVKELGLALAILIMFLAFAGFTAYEVGQNSVDKCVDTGKKPWECGDEAKAPAAIVLVILGLIAITIGILIKDVSAISGGLIFGGAISLLASIIIYWEDMTGIIKIFISFVTLMGLIAIGWFKLKD